MTDPSSPIFHFYPAGEITCRLNLYSAVCNIFSYSDIYMDTFLTDFEIDMNGKRFAWQVLQCSLCIQIVFELTKS